MIGGQQGGVRDSVRDRFSVVAGGQQKQISPIEERRNVNENFTVIVAGQPWK